MFPDASEVPDIDPDVLDPDVLDPDVLDDGELAEAVVELHRQQARLAAMSARLVGAADTRRVWADDGYRNTATWLAHRCRLPVKDARAEVRLARRLRTMPATAAAFRAGDIGAAQAHRLASLNAPRTAAAFAEAESTLVGYATSMDWVDFARAAAYWRQVVDPAGAEDDAASDEALRRVHLSETLGGTGILDGVLTPVGRETVANALGRIEGELFEADWADARQRLGEGAEPTVADLARTPAQRRHDALVEMATRAMTAPKDGKRPLPLVSVLVGYETFAGRICELASGTVVSPGTAAALLDEAVVERVVFDGPSRVIDLGHHRLFTGGLRRAIQLRDRQCVGPGCHARSEDCEIDHLEPHSHGGPTDQGNAGPRCPFHHRDRHRRDARARPSRSARPQGP